MDIFDRIAAEKQSEPDDIFSEIETEDNALNQIKTLVSDLSDKIDSRNRKQEKAAAVSQIEAVVKAELAKIKPTQKVIERQVQKEIRHVEVPVRIPPPPPPQVIERPAQIIREVRVEVPAKGDAEEKIKKLEERLAELEVELKETRRRADSPIVLPGGPGVIGVPPPEGHEGKFLKVVNNKWTYGAGGGGASVSGFTVSNPGSVTSIDATNISYDDLCSIVAQLINQLQA